jgi:hypothetical protein
MSSDNQFTALGAPGLPTPRGFFTNGDNITYGVNVQGVDRTGQGCGVYAEAMLNSPGLRASQDGTRPGVWGVGDHYGVYGASGNLYSSGIDNTPQPVDPTAGLGGIGVVGASLKMPGVLGTSDLTNESTGGFVNAFVPLSAGVMGLSNTSVGVVGANMNVGGDPNHPQQPRVFDIIDVIKSSAAGVFGWSTTDRGGVFGSAVPAGSGVPVHDVGTAQVRLLPVNVTLARVPNSRPPAHATPNLPILGQAGDLIAVVAEKGSTQLWFCIDTGIDATTAATWAEISFNRTIPGNR